MKSTLKSTLPGSMVSFSFGSPSGTEDGSVRVFVLEENADVYMLDISLISNQRSLFMRMMIKLYPMKIQLDHISCNDTLF